MYCVYLLHLPTTRGRTATDRRFYAGGVGATIRGGAATCRDLVVSGQQWPHRAKELPPRAASRER